MKLFSAHYRGCSIEPRNRESHPIPGSEQSFADRFRKSNLSTLTQLILSELKEAVLFTKGRLAGKFGPGSPTLNTGNLTFLRNSFGTGVDFTSDKLTEHVWGLLV